MTGGTWGETILVPGDQYIYDVGMAAKIIDAPHGGVYTAYNGRYFGYRCNEDGTASSDGGFVNRYGKVQRILVRRAGTVQRCNRCACYNERNGRECWSAQHPDGQWTHEWGSEGEAKEAAMRDIGEFPATRRMKTC